MKTWTRTTHNFDNETREWKVRDNLPEFPIDNPYKSVGVHALENGEWRCLSQIMATNKTALHPETISEETLLEELETLEALGVIKSKEHSIH